MPEYRSNKSKAASTTIAQGMFKEEEEEGFRSFLFTISLSLNADVAWQRTLRFCFCFENVCFGNCQEVADHEALFSSKKVDCKLGR